MSVGVGASAGKLSWMPVIRQTIAAIERPITGRFLIEKKGDLLVKDGKIRSRNDNRSGITQVLVSGLSVPSLPSGELSARPSGGSFTLS